MILNCHFILNKTIEIHFELSLYNVDFEFIYIPGDLSEDDMFKVLNLARRYVDFRRTYSRNAVRNSCCEFS